MPTVDMRAHEAVPDEQTLDAIRVVLGSHAHLLAGGTPDDLDVPRPAHLVAAAFDTLASMAMTGAAEARALAVVDECAGHCATAERRLDGLEALVAELERRVTGRAGGAR